MSKLDEMNKQVESETSYTRNDLKAFLAGFLLASLGLLVIFKSTSVSASWYSWRLGSFSLPGGTTTIPLLIGIGMQFYNPKSIWGKLITFLGLAFIVITIIMSVHIRFNSTSLFNYILMFGATVAGIGLMTKGLFPTNKN